MIIDKISNVLNYAEVPEHAVKFIAGLSSDIEVGKYNLSEFDYANVELYSTKNIEDAKFESHKDYIDIQILVSGSERIYYTDTKELTTGIPYNKEKDIEFYADRVIDKDYMTLNGTNFVMIFPHEAHAPQVSINNDCQIVKKVVLKLRK